MKKLTKEEFKNAIGDVAEAILLNANSHTPQSAINSLWSALSDWEVIMYVDDEEDDEDSDDETQQEIVARLLQQKFRASFPRARGATLTRQMSMALAQEAIDFFTADSPSEDKSAEGHFDPDISEYPARYEEMLRGIAGKLIEEGATIITRAEGTALSLDGIQIETTPHEHGILMEEWAEVRRDREANSGG